VKQKTILRVVRFVLLAGVVLSVAFFFRGNQKFGIPEADQSLYPRFPGGTTVVVEEIDADAPLERGADVVYAMEKEGVDYARFGRVRALPGDVVGAKDGKLTVNGELIGPIAMPGDAMGEVPPGKLLILATNPAETRYPDSRSLGFIARDRVQALILYRLG